MPALTFGVSTNFALANFLASRSFGNVSVALTRARFPRGSSNETYHVPLGLLAMVPSRGLLRRLTDRGRDLNRRLTKSFRLPPASPQDSFSGLAGVGQPSEPERTSDVSGVMAGSAIHPSSASAFPSAFLYDQLTFVRRRGSKRAAPRCANASRN